MDFSPEDIQFALGIHPSQQVAAVPVQQQPPDDDAATPQPRPVSEPAQPKEATEAKPPALISPPPTGVRALAQPSLSRAVIGPSDVDMPTSATPEPAAPMISVPGASPAPPPVDLFHAPITPRPISADQEQMQGLQAREAKDRTEFQRLQDTGSGVSQFQQHHRILGPIVRGLSIAGTALAPELAAEIPGTDIHHRVLLNQAHNRVESDIGDEAKHQAITSKEEADTAREQGLTIREQAEKDREAQNEAINDLKQQAQDSKDALRSITYDPATKQFMRGGEVYTPKDFQEGAVLETQHGVPGPYTEKWMAEKRNQAPRTTIHTPSAESEEFNEWRHAFQAQYGRDPNSDDILKYKRGEKGGKDYTSQRVAAESRKEAELNRLEMEFNRDWSKADNDQERDRLTAGHNANKARVQKAYEAELAQIPTGEQQPPERVVPSSVPSAGAPQATKPTTQYTRFATGPANHRIGYNPTTKQWEDVQTGQPVR